MKKGEGLDVRAEEMTKWKAFDLAGAAAARAKVLVERGSDRILGAQLFGDGAGENIHIFAVAMRAGLTARDLRRMIFAYPTFASTIPSLL